MASATEPGVLENELASFGVFRNGKPATLQIRPEGIEIEYSCAPEGFICCATDSAACDIPVAALLGATLESVPGNEPRFWLHHVNVRASGKLLSIMRTGPLVMDDLAIAERVVARVRTASCAGAMSQGSKRNVVAIVNPFAGKRRGMKCWEEVENILRMAGISSEVHATTHPGHAVELAAMLEIGSCGVLAVVGGDGTMHEVVQACLARMFTLGGVQGLVRHLDAPAALKLPICHVPAGSGNGLSASCGLWTPRHAALAILKGATCTLDAATVVQPRSNTRRLAILSVQMGMLTDLDLGTEHLRKLLGGERFTYGAVREVFKWKPHAARIAVFSGDHKTVAETGSDQRPVNGGKWPETPLLDKVFAAGEPNFSDHIGWPEGWHVKHLDNIHFFNLMGPPWAALDYHLNPWSSMSDGAWEWTMDACTNRLQALSMISSTQSGKHRESPLFKTQHFRAFAIEPLEKTTFLTVDGEEVPYERLFVEIHRGLLNMVTCDLPGTL